MNLNRLTNGKEFLTNLEKKAVENIVGKGENVGKFQKTIFNV